MRMHRRTVLLCALSAVIVAGAARGQQPPYGAPAPAATMKEVMLDLVHPASNDIQFAISRPPQNEKEWANVRHSALVLAEAGDTLMSRGAGPWQNYANLLVNAGRAAYKAAQTKDAAALAQVGPALDASCTTCHKQFRPNVFPKEGASK